MTPITTAVAAPEFATAPMAELLRLDGRGAVVTGGATGVGRAIAERLSEAGAAVVVADIDGDAATATALELRDRFGGNATAATADVCAAEDMRRVARCAVAEAGGLHIWVNNAGIFPPAHPVTATRETVGQILDVNVIGTHLGCQAAVEQMLPSGGGVIVNVASTAAFRGAGAYAASKWAVRGMTSGLAAHLGKDGIRVVAVAPTVVTTPGTDEVRRRGGERMQQLFDDAVGQLPLGRAAQPDDVARAVLFLASDAAAFITGVTLPVDGGGLAI
jgi:NAD(P)-dependent dehydrogenase (short-subunit alcohol dehydrogenase family)